MTKTASSNYTAAGTNFQIPGADSDSFDRTDISTLGQAVEEHTHASTRGLQVPTGGIADDAVTNDKLANITRGSVKVGGASNAPTDLVAKTSGQILVGDGTDILSVAVSGDATLASSGALTIANNAVTNAKAAGMTRGTIKVGNSAGAASDLNAKTGAYLVMGNGSDVVSQAMSGDVTIDATGVTAIGDQKITTAMITDANVTTAKIADLNVTADKIAANSVDDTKVGNRVPMLTRRQGGNATNWDTSGTTDYTPTAVKMQCGALAMTIAEETGTVTFPQAFSAVPIVIATVFDATTARYPTITAISTTQVTIKTASANHTIFWLAIGPE